MDVDGRRSSYWRLLSWNRFLFFCLFAVRSDSNQRSESRRRFSHRGSRTRLHSKVCSPFEENRQREEGQLSQSCTETSKDHSCRDNTRKRTMKEGGGRETTGDIRNLEEFLLIASLFRNCSSEETGLMRNRGPKYSSWGLDDASERRGQGAFLTRRSFSVVLRSYGPEWRQRGGLCLNPVHVFRSSFIYCNFEMTMNGQTWILQLPVDMFFSQKLTLKASDACSGSAKIWFHLLNYSRSSFFCKIQTQASTEAVLCVKKQHNTLPFTEQHLRFTRV